MIVHLFRGDFTHLTIPIIESIIVNSEKDHYFLLPVFKDENKGKYNQLLERFPPEQFLIFDSSNHTKLSKILMNLIGNKGENALEEAAIATALYKFRKNTIISHFYFKSYALLPFFKSYSWICWGNIPRGDTNNSKVGAIKFNYYTKRILRRCKHIVTLMNPDKEELINNFYCEEENISVIPYISNEKELIPVDIEYRKSYGKQKILLGNNTYLIKSYINALSFLSHYADHCILYAMMSYGDASILDTQSFLSKAEEIYKDNFIPVVEFIPLENYNNWLNQFDIYISNAQTQSGLGTIYSMLGLGKKVYLEGSNYEWCVKNELAVFHVNNLSTGKLSNLLPLSRIDRENNKKILNTMLDSVALSQKWDEFYSKL